MDADSNRPKGRNGALSSLNVTIEAMNLAKEIAAIAPAKVAFGSVSALLTMIRDSMANELDYVELGLSCADICRALERGMNGKRLDDLNQSVCDAIGQLTITVGEIQRRVIKRTGRNAVSRLFHAKNDKESIAAWRSDLSRVLQVFTTELVVNTHTMVLDLHRDRNAGTGQEGTDDQRPTQPTSTTSNANAIGSSISPLRNTPPGELPPPPPRACFGRDEFVEKIISLAGNLTPIALIGPGGIGKTSIALTVLHHSHIKERFGDDRRFIRCDQFPASRAHLLSRLSKAIGAGIENPEDLTPLRPSLSSREMILILDNAESILDPQGTNAQEIYNVVEELSEFPNICLCLTSRISTTPPACKTLNIPVLSMEAARAAFYQICENTDRPDLVDNILEQLDFHPLSVTLLATVAHHNKWDNNQLARQWGQQRTGVLRTEHNRSLAAAIELSLASPMFQELGPDTRELLGVVAFFPQGINEDNIDWLFPMKTRKNIFRWSRATVTNRRDSFNKFCILSLTYRSGGFITMLAPLRDYLCPKDPKSSPLLSTTKKHYFHRLRVDVDPGKPGFEEAQWITSEDVNVEHLLDAFTSTDADSDSIWVACVNFMEHLYWHKPRLVVLGPKIEGLPDSHPSKSDCLFHLSQLFSSVGNHMEYKRLLVCALKLQRERGGDLLVAQTLRFISDANERLGLHEEGIQQANEALEIYRRHNNVLGQAQSLKELAWLLFSDNQLDMAEEAASKAIELFSNRKDNQFQVCDCHRILGNVYQSKGERGKAANQFEIALGIASSFNWHDLLFWNQFCLAELFLGDDRFDEAHSHIERAKPHAINDPYQLGRATELQARVWYKQRDLAEAKSEALEAINTFEKIGAAEDVGRCTAFLRVIEEATIELVASREH